MMKKLLSLALLVQFLGINSFLVGMANPDAGYDSDASNAAEYAKDEANLEVARTSALEAIKELKLGGNIPHLFKSRIKSACTTARLDAIKDEAQRISTAIANIRGYKYLNGSIKKYIQSWIYRYVTPEKSVGENMAFLNFLCTTSEQLCRRIEELNENLDENHAAQADEETLKKIKESLFKFSELSGDEARKLQMHALRSCTSEEQDDSEEALKTVLKRLGKMVHRASTVSQLAIIGHKIALILSLHIETLPDLFNCLKELFSSFEGVKTVADRLEEIPTALSQETAKSLLKGSTLQHWITMQIILLAATFDKDMSVAALGDLTQEIISKE